MDIAAQKAELRREATVRRKAAAAEGAADAARHALNHFDAAIGVEAGTTASAYLPVGDEFDALPFLAALDQRGVTTALPVVAGADRPLLFRRWTPGDRLVDGRYDIPVPADDAEIVVPTLLIVPMLAFDDDGYRLGYGGGFYDRTLAALRAELPATLAVGLAFAAQRVDHVPHEATDQPLDWVVTETGATRCGAG